MHTIILPTRQELMAMNEAEMLYKMYKANNQLDPRTIPARSLTGEGMVITLGDKTLTIIYASGEVSQWTDDGSVPLPGPFEIIQPTVNQSTSTTPL